MNDLDLETCNWWELPQDNPYIAPISKSCIYNRINSGQMCPPISLGARAVGFIYSEVIAVVKAMISGKSQDKIKALVQELLTRRQQQSFQ